MSKETIKAAIIDCVESVNRHPQNAQLMYVAETRLDEGMRTISKVRDFPEMILDEPPILGGTDQGMTPAEVVLSAMGTCQVVMYSTYATMMDIELSELKITSYGDLDVQGMLAINDNICPGFTSISFDVHIASPAGPDKIRDLIALAETHCPLLDTITRPVPVNSRTYLNGDLINDMEAMLPPIDKPQPLASN